MSIEGIHLLSGAKKQEKVEHTNLFDHFKKLVDYNYLIP